MQRKKKPRHTCAHEICHRSLTVGGRGANGQQGKPGRGSASLECRLLLECRGFNVPPPQFSWFACPIIGFLFCLNTHERRSLCRKRKRFGCGFCHHDCFVRLFALAGEHQKLAAQMRRAKDEFNEYERKDIQHQEGLKHFKEQVCSRVCACRRGGEFVSPPHGTDCARDACDCFPPARPCTRTLSGRNLMSPTGTLRRGGLAALAGGGGGGRRNCGKKCRRAQATPPCS